MTDYISNYTGEEIDAGIAKANTALQSYEYLNSVIEQAFDEITDEDTEITLNNTIQAKIKMELKGNTKQTTYTGKNLINFPYYETTKTVNGITFTVKNDGTIHVEGTASAGAYFVLRNRDINLSITEGETYTLATSGLGIIDNTLWLDTYGQTGNFLDVWALPQTSTYTSAVAQSKDKKPLLRISVANGATVNRDVKVWLYKGSYDETTTYEPYVGGTPSPNPDYPQDVRVVTGNNSVNVIGKNLWNENTQIFVNQSRFSNPTKDNNNVWIFTISGNDGYAFATSNITLPAGTYTASATVNNGDFILQKNGITINNTFTLTEETEITFRVYKNGVIGDVVKLSNVMFEKSSQATTYKPYQSQTYSINLGTMELCKIGDYQDYIYKDNGKWYKHSEIGKVVLDGTQAISQINTNQINTTRIMYQNISDNSINDNVNLYCNRLSGLIMWGTDNEGIYTNANAIVFRINKSTIGTTETDVNTYLSSNNIILYYPLATPTNEEITDTTLISQLNAIENAMSYKTQTNISQTNANLPFILYASALGKNQ